MSVLFAHESPVRGKLSVAGGHLIANLDWRVPSNPLGQPSAGGIGAFDLLTGEPQWTVSGVPPLASADHEWVYAYTRTGVVVGLDHTGVERWRTTLTDDRAPPAQARGDREAPFVGDVLVQDGEIVLAAGAEILRLASADGRILGRTTVCAGEHGVVARLGAGSDGTIVATSTSRTAWDDECYPLERKLWEVQPSLESLRLTPGEVVGFEPDLRERWRLATLEDGALTGDRAPIISRGVVVLATARTAKDGDHPYVSLDDDRLVGLDEQTGQVRWVSGMPGGRGYVDPVAVDDSVVAGFEPVLFALQDGSIRWHLRMDRPRLDPRVPPLVDSARLLFAADNQIVSVDVLHGDARVAAHLSELTAQARFTTRLSRGPFGVYFGLADPERPTMLWGMFLE